MTNSAMLDHRAEPNSGVGKRHHRGRPSQVEYRKMKGLELNLLRSMSWIAVAMALLLWAPTASLAESSSAAGQLSVGERDQRFAPAIRSAILRL
jgi:hypothetical protein